MSGLVLEAAVRSLALGLLTWLAVVALRIRNPHIEKLIWTTVLLGALAMPALMQWTIFPAQVPTTWVVASDVSIRGALIRAPGQWLSVFALLYAIVASLLLLRLAVAFGRVWRLRRGSSRLYGEWTQGADVRVVKGLCSPATFGSTILLPADQDAWTEAKRAAVVAHERAHVRGLDCHVQWLAALHTCVFWFSPLSWWLRKHLMKLAEH